MGSSASVMTWNLYTGTDVGAVLRASPEEAPQRVARAWEEIVRSRPAERMARVAAEIATHRPEVVGLQEVSTLRARTLGEARGKNAGAPKDARLDFLELLLAALRGRNVIYEVASVVENVDVEVTAANPPTRRFFDVRLIDRGVTLVRRGAPYTNAQGGNFHATHPVAIGTANFPFVRGWTSVDVKVGGSEVRFVNVHLETQDAGALNERQGLELLEVVSSSPLPVVMVGDFNSAANDSAPEDRKTPTYRNVLAAGFTDAWVAGNPGEEGLTGCHHPSLMATGPFDQRIDFVFYDGSFREAGRRNTIVGGESSRLTESGLFPSDHAGIVSRVRLR